MYQSRTIDNKNRKRSFTLFHSVQDDKLYVKLNEMLIACIALAKVQHDNADRYLDTYFQAGIHGGVSVSKLPTT